jgi:hypothetical protein
MLPIGAERPANSGLLQFGVPSLCSRLLGMTTEFRESLWLTPRIFPFLGDAGETGFDHALRGAGRAVKFTIFFSSRSVVLGAVDPVLPPEDGNRLNFKPVKPYRSRLLWRDRSGKAQTKLLLTSPEDILAICDPRYGRYCRHGKGGFPRQALPQTDKLTFSGLEARHAYGVTRLYAPPAPSHRNRVRGPASRPFG